MSSVYDDPIGNIVLKHEGGFVNDPDDRGGATNLGITQRTLSGWRGYDVSVDEVRNLTEAEAREIYEMNYLKKPKIDWLPFPHPQVFVMDMAVNHGPRRAVKILQKTINKAGLDNVGTDGRMGPMTKAAAEKAQQVFGNEFQNMMVDERKEFYERIIEDNPRQEKFRRGWMRRAESFRLESTTDLA